MLIKFLILTLLCLKLLLIIFICCSTAFTMQVDSARHRGWWKWKWKDLKSASLEIRETIVAPK